jgi:hypothetical protein
VVYQYVVARVPHSPLIIFSTVSGSGVSHSGYLYAEQDITSVPLVHVQYIDVPPLGKLGLVGLDVPTEQKEDEYEVIEKEYTEALPPQIGDGGGAIYV